MESFYRVLIRELLYKNGSLEGRRNALQDPRLQIGRALDEMYAGSLHQVDSTWLNIGKGLQEGLSSGLNRDDISVIICGSAVSGGRVLKSIFNTDSKNGYKDFDWIITTDTPLTDFQKTQIRSIEHFEVPVLGAANNVKGIVDPCYAITGSRIQLLNLSDKKMALEMIYGPFRQFVHGNPIVYFYPSIPEKTNKKNAALFLDALRHVYVHDRPYWEGYTHALVQTWKEKHSIKGPTEESRRIPTGVDAFTRLLESTRSQDN